MAASASTVQAHETEDGLVLQVMHDNDDETLQVMHKLKKLMQRIDGNEGSNTGVPSLAFDEAFGEIFDASLQARVQPVRALLSEHETADRTTISCHEYKNVWLELQERGYAVTVKDYQRYMTGAFDFTVELTPAHSVGGESNANKIVFRTAAMMKDSKIVYVEQKVDPGPKPSIILQAVPASRNPKQPAKPSSSWAFASVSSVGDDDNDDDDNGYHEDETIKAAIEQFSAFVHAGNEDTKPPVDYEDMFHKVFDPNVTASLKPIENLGPDSKLMEMNYETLYQEHYLKAFELGYKKEVVRIKPHIRGVVAFTVHMVNESSELTVRYNVLISNETGLIAKVEAMETIFKTFIQPEPVSGQVVATDAALIPGFKTEQELAQAILPVSGKILAGSKSGIKPCQQTGYVVKLYMEREKKLMHLQIFKEERLNIYDSQGNPYAGGVHFKEYKRRVVTGKALVLNDANSEPRAFCFQDFVLVGRKAFDVYSTRPLWSGDAPFEKEEGVFCYPWFRMEAQGDHHRTIMVWNGRGYQSIWSAFLGKKPGKDQDPHHPPNKGDIVLKTASLDADLAYVKVNEEDNEKGKVRYDIVIAPGVDPGLIVCIAAVLEIMVGLFG